MILIYSSLTFLQTEKKLVAGIRLQYVSPKMERVFERIQSCFQETMSLAENSGPREAEVIAPQPSPFQMKRYQKQHVGKSTGKVAPGSSAPQQGQQCGGAHAATIPPSAPAPQTCREACDGNRQNEESCSFHNDPQRCSENCYDVMSPAQTVLLSALENLSSNDW